MRTLVQFSILLSLSTGICSACSCAISTTRVAKDEAGVVFRGTITALRDAGKSDPKKIAIFRVSRVWKGEVGQTFEMPAVEETSMCVGFWPSLLKVGNDLLVYAKQWPRSAEYYTTICTRTRLVKDAKEDFDDLGPGETPKQTQKPDSK